MLSYFWQIKAHEGHGFCVKDVNRASQGVLKAVLDSGRQCQMGHLVVEETKTESCRSLGQ